MSNNGIKVSIVVPVYNVEKYLKECIKSCQNQTLKEIEIICVDDGSTDSSLEVIKSIASKDSRVKYISKKNSGYGNTMNRGFDAAVGEYIGICESDDYIEPDMYEILYNTAKTNNLDVVKSDYMTFRTVNGNRKQEYEQTCTDIKYYNKVLIPKVTKEMFRFQMNTWTGIYRKDFIRENNIRHNETPGASYQDNGFWFQTLSLAKSVMFVNRAFYHYRQDNPNSSINSSGKVFCMNEEYKFIHDFMIDNEKVNKNFKYEFFRKKFFNYMHTYARIAEKYKLDFMKRFSEELNEEFNSKEFSFNLIDDEWVKTMCCRIMDDYSAFYYEDAMYRLSGKLANAEERLGKLRNSEELKKGRKVTTALGKFIK